MGVSSPVLWQTKGRYVEIESGIVVTRGWGGGWSGSERAQFIGMKVQLGDRNNFYCPLGQQGNWLRKTLSISKLPVERIVNVPNTNDKCFWKCSGYVNHPDQILYIGIKILHHIPHMCTIIIE